MAAQTVLNVNNVVLPVAPATYWVGGLTPQTMGPSTTPTEGIAVPLGKTAWELLFDTTGLPPGQVLVGVMLQYMRAAQWTDKDGVVHPPNEWRDDFGVPDLRTGPQGRPISNVARINSTIGATGPGGSMVEPYPARARFRVDQCPGWTVANIKLNLF